MGWAEGGLAVPALDERPWLEPHEQYAVESYLEIANSRRPSGFGPPTPVPLSEVASAYTYFELGEHYTRREWSELVCMLDAVVLDYHARTNKKAAPTKPKR